MRSFNVFKETRIYQDLKRSEQLALEAAYNILSERTVEDAIAVSVADNIKDNYDVFRYLQDDIELLVDWCDIPLENYAFFKTTINMVARLNKETTRIWK
jgi:hypothetical protein